MFCFIPKFVSYTRSTIHPGMIKFYFMSYVYEKKNIIFLTKKNVFQSIGGGRLSWSAWSAMVNCAPTRRNQTTFTCLKQLNSRLCSSRIRFIYKCTFPSFTQLFYKHMGKTFLCFTVRKKTFFFYNEAFYKFQVFCILYKQYNLNMKDCCLICWSIPGKVPGRIYSG